MSVKVKLIVLNLPRIMLRSKLIHNNDEDVLEICLISHFDFIELQERIDHRFEEVNGILK